MSPSPSIPSLALQGASCHDSMARAWERIRSPTPTLGIAREFSAPRLQFDRVADMHAVGPPQEGELDRGEASGPSQRLCLSPKSLECGGTTPRERLGFPTLSSSELALCPRR
jgi:hypothetical protein